MTRPLLLTTLLMTSVTSGCASNVTPKEDRAESDPWEPLNRSLYRIHDGIDRATLKPVARGYKKIVPPIVRRGVTNFSQNLFVPGSIVNNLLQGKPDGAAAELARLMLNSTIGLLGIIDVASMANIEKHDETFRQTFAVWRIPEGPYLFVPIIGPRTLTDAIALPLDIAFDPLWHYDVSSVRDPLYVLRVINLRSRLLTADTLLESSTDPYITMRESYLQNREYEIYDGDPPMDDDFYDDFEDFEDVDDEFSDQAPH